MEKNWNSDLRQRKKDTKLEKRRFDKESLSSNRETANESISNAVGYGIIIAILCSLRFFYIFENLLPTPISLKEASSHPETFIGERAELQLKRLTDLGTRVVGSYENEVLAVDFLKREISFIQQEADSRHKIEVDIQKPTGSYYLFLKPYGFRNYYANIQNVVVKLSSSDTTNGILLNCHYDTVPESPGASDNGLNCVVLLEILRVLSTRKTPLKNHIIFLFNGAEENPLQASHGFLSQHKWKNEVKVVINLDSGGAGGKEMLFQTSGETWLLNAYSKVVPHPTAGVQGEELFQFGIIPSDTDFRIFRDFGGYPGYDLAHCTNGYIYHTKYDKMEFIQPGVYQNTGDNILALVKELANSDELTKNHSKSKIVYFDVFGVTVISYAENTAFAINMFTVILSFCAAIKAVGSLQGINLSILKTLFISVDVQLLGLSLAAAVVFLISKTLDFYKSTMSWYLRPWLIIPLYAFPVTFAIVAGLFLMHRQMKKNLLGHNIIFFINGAQLLWTIILFIGTLLGIRSSFILMLFILVPSLGTFIFFAFNKNIYKVKTYLLVYGICLIFPVMFLLNQSVRIFTVIIPMTARMGPHVNPEVIIGGLTFILATISMCQIIPIFLFLKKLKSFIITLCIFHVLAMIGIIYTKYGFPYDGNVGSPALQRFYILHTERTFYDVKGSVRRADSGIFVQALDRNNINYVSEFIPELKEAETRSQDCQTEIFCGFPVFTSRFIKPAPYSYWIPANAPTIHHPSSLEVLNQTQISVRVKRIRILISGPDHITIGMSPRQNVKLIKWSFDEGQPIEIESWNNRKTYMVYYSHGLMGGNLEFDVDLEVNQDSTDFLLDIAVVGHYMHDKKFRTAQFKKLLSQFPDWAHITPWTTTYKSWII